MSMDRIVILGGGVGGTLTANLLARRLGARIAAGGVDVTLIDAQGAHVYQPGFMYIAMGGEREERLARPERSLLDAPVSLIVDRAVRVDVAARTVVLEGGAIIPYDYLVLATGSRITPDEIPFFAQEAHHFYSAKAALELRHALDAFSGGRVVVGIASMPYKCPPAPLEVAFLIEAELRERGLRDRSEVHFCSPIGRAFTIETVSDMATPILEEKGIELHTFFNVEAIDPERKVVTSLEGEELGYDDILIRNDALTMDVRNAMLEETNRLFSDVLEGGNDFAGVAGYEAGKGWDAATGLGSANAARLVRALLR